MILIICKCEHELFEDTTANSTSLCPCRVSAFLQAQYNVSSTGEQVAGGKGAGVLPAPVWQDSTQARGSTHTCVCPAVSLVQDEIIHQNCPAETLWDKVQRHANDKSMFAEQRKTVSSEWIGNGRTKVKPFQTPLYLCIVHVEGLQMSKRNRWFCRTWCMH